MQDTKTTFQKTRIGDVATLNPGSLGRKFSLDKIFYVDIKWSGLSRHQIALFKI